jgi:hypothetical protein
MTTRFQSDLRNPTLRTQATRTAERDRVAVGRRICAERLDCGSRDVRRCVSAEVGIRLVSELRLASRPSHPGPVEAVGIQKRSAYATDPQNALQPSCGVAAGRSAGGTLRVSLPRNLRIVVQIAGGANPTCGLPAFQADWVPDIGTVHSLQLIEGFHCANIPDGFGLQIHTCRS